MLIYNVTVNVDAQIEENWKAWMQITHIPDMLATGKFLEATMTRVLVEEEMGGCTYSIQYKVKDRKTLEQYYKEDAARLRNDTLKTFGDALVAFRTELEVVTINKPFLKSATTYLFTYGTLQEKEVQQTIFQRDLIGSKDRLKDYKISDDLVGGLYPTISLSPGDKNGVTGYLYIISEEELNRVDAYEGVAYKRKMITLESGIKAWVYMDKLES